MKALHNLNKWSFIITVVLYLTFYFGLIAQAFLGAIQIILAISILVKWKQLGINSRRLISTYWLLVGTYGLIVYVFDSVSDHVELLLIAIIPMSIAAYFVFVTYKMRTESTEIISHEIL